MDGNIKRLQLEPFFLGKIGGEYRSSPLRCLIRTLLFLLDHKLLEGAFTGSLVDHASRV